jgi:hypothetical protein
VSQWNISFQAPSLKKHHCPAERARANSVVEVADIGDQEDEKKTDDYSEGGQRARLAQHLSMPLQGSLQPLFEEPIHTLSDTQFQLLYGLPRRRFDALSSEEQFLMQVEAIKRRSNLLKSLNEVAAEDTKKRRATLLNVPKEEIDVPEEMFLNRSF